MTEYISCWQSESAAKKNEKRYGSDFFLITKNHLMKMHFKFICEYLLLSIWVKHYSTVLFN